MVSAQVEERQKAIRQGQRLEYFTVGWNSLEALASLITGALAGSVSLVGFGLDSVIEVASSVALLWRLHYDLDVHRREDAERRALQMVGWSFIALALYIGYESVSTLIGHAAPKRSLAGILVAAAALIVMPILAKAKRRVSTDLGSRAMHADSRQTDFCAYLSAILLGGLLLNAVFGWWWADPVAGLLMVPIVAKEGVEGLKGKACCGNCAHR